MASTMGPVCRMTNCCSGPATWCAANNGPVGVDLGGGYVGFDRGRDLLAEAVSKGLARALLHPTLQIGRRRRAGRELQDADEPVPPPTTERTRAVVGGQGELGRHRPLAVGVERANQFGLDGVRIDLRRRLDVHHRHDGLRDLGHGVPLLRLLDTRALQSRDPGAEPQVPDWGLLTRTRTNRGSTRPGLAPPALPSTSRHDQNQRKVHIRVRDARSAQPGGLGRPRTPCDSWPAAERGAVSGRRAGGPWLEVGDGTGSSLGA